MDFYSVLLFCFIFNFESSISEFVGGDSVSNLTFIQISFFLSQFFFFVLFISQTEKMRYSSEKANRHAICSRRYLFIYLRIYGADTLLMACAKINK